MPTLDAQLELDEVTSFVLDRHGVDLASYRQTTVERRVRARMQRVGAPDPDAYLRLLRGDAAEAEELLRFIRISVSRFYRSASAFDRIGATVLPTLAREHPSIPLRIWSAGCSTGEEPYSLLMLAETGLRGGARAVALTATDVDGHTLARVTGDGVQYAEESVQDLPDMLRSRYLDLVPGPRPAYRPNARLAALAEGVRWAQHDLLSAAAPDPEPFHLISCRNVLIYLNRVEQERVQHFLADCLVPGGYLFLGEAEALAQSVAHRFQVVDSAARIFRLAPRPGGDCSTRGGAR